MEKNQAIQSNFPLQAAQHKALSCHSPQRHPGFWHRAQLPMQVTEAGLRNQLCSYYTLCSGDRVPPSGTVFLKAHAMKAAVSMICPLACACIN